MKEDTSKTTMSIVIYHFVIVILLLLRLESLEVVTALASNNNLENNIFKPEHSDASQRLSANQIVSMMPTAKNNNNGPLRQNLFTSPIIPALYEKVLPPLWEAGLRLGGPETEYLEAAKYLKQGKMVLDLSCGTGFVGRRLAQNKDFEKVFCLDYSEEMLGECLRSVEREKAGNNNFDNLSLIRGDASCLPFADDTLDAVHWGAAMHCVPDVELALQEVYRILKPGGKLYATTFLKPFPDVVFRFFTTRELRELSIGAGFDNQNLFVEQRGVYGIVRATK